MKLQKKYYSKEDIFLSRMASILKVPQGVAKNMFRQRVVSTIRINTLKGSYENILDKLISKKLELKDVPWAKNTFIVENMDKSDLGKMKEYYEGLFYIQNLSSLLPSIILDPSSKDTILDMCASPGSKTSHLSDLMNNKGKIVANDVDAWRTKKLKEVLDMFGVKNAQITNEDGTVFGKREFERFDKVLLDAPCSGEGLIYLTSPSALKFWNVKKVRGLVRIQTELIFSAFNSLKKGGTLIYSTCTLEPDENEGIVSKLLEKYQNADIVEVPLFDSIEFKDYKKNVKRGILNWNGKDYDKRVSKTYRVLPSSEMMGFYIAKIVKN